MRVKFIKSHYLYSYFAGDIAELADPKELIEGGFAVEIPEEKPEVKEAPKAEVKKGKRK